MPPLRPLPWLVALLVSAMACSAPPVVTDEPAAAYFERKGSDLRTYHLRARVPMLVEARCRLVDQPLLDNPHFDRQAVHLRWAWTDYLPVHLQSGNVADHLPVDIRFLATSIEDRRYSVWLKVDGSQLESSYYSEEELGALDLPEAASAAYVAAERVGRKRRVERQFLSSQLVAVWTGEATWGARTGWRAFPALDAALVISGTTRGVTGASGGRMDLDVPWEAVCGRAWRNR
jgi:hypothetical protein